MVQTIINIILLFTVAYLMTKDIQRGCDLYELKQKTDEIKDIVNGLLRREKE